MADAASYDSGQYTGWDAAPDPAAAPTTTAAAWDTWTADSPPTSAAADQDWTPTTTTQAWTEQAWTPTTTTSAAASSWTTTTAAWSSPSSSSPTWTQPSSSSPTSSSTTAMATSSTSSSSSSSPASSPTLAASSSTSSSDRFATVSRYSNPSQAALASDASGNGTSSGSPFKISYLIPVFVGLPIIAAFALAACTYGKWWGRGNKARSAAHGGDDDEGPYTEGNAGAGAWWGGAVGGGSWRSRKGGVDPEQDAEERGGLVEGKWVGDGYDEKDGASPAKGGAAGASRWSGLLGGGGARPERYEDHPDVPFLSISHAPPLQQQDAPFVPPPRSSSTHDFLARGQVAPQGPSARHLGPGPWASASAAQRWVARSGSVRSTSSRLSDKIRARFGIGQGARDDCPSPSVYSPNVEAGTMGTAGAYMGLHTALEEDDDDLDDGDKVDYDALLGAARVGHGDLARKYAQGEVTDEQLFPRPRSDQRIDPALEHDARERYYARHGAPSQPGSSGPFAPQPYRDAPPAFAVALPSAPSRLQVSPKKSATVLSRAAPETPERERTHALGSGDLLFSYESPARSAQAPPASSASAQRRPLPSAPRASPTRASAAPLTDAPARIPFRQQAAPQLSRHAPPPSSASRPDIFSSGAAAPPPQKASRATVGSPMPAYDGRAPEDEALSLDGVDALVFGAPAAAPQSQRRSTASGGGRTSPTKERALGPRAEQQQRPSQQQPKHKRSGSDLQQGMVSSSSAARQHAPEASAASRSRSTPTKVRPVSAYAHLPSQPQQQQHQQQQRMSKVPSRQDLRSTAAAPTSRPRESLGFDPTFGEGPALAPLQHPSKVRAAIENIETRGPAPPPSSQHRKTASSSSSSPTKAPGPSAGAPAPTTYRRALGRKGLDSDSDDDDERISAATHDSGDAEALATKRRLSTLILNRSKSQSGALGAGAGEGDSSPEPTSFENEARRERPLSSDPRRLSMMLRRGSSGAHLATLGNDE